MNKQHGAFLTIGELASELDVPQHILRYWETRFPMLRPLQRAGNRRYYRNEDVELARRIHHLLTVEGYTVRGAQKALEGKASQEGKADPVVASVVTAEPAVSTRFEPDVPAVAADDLVAKLSTIRAKLASTLS
ncbi:MAG: MerR family transcriptional regulator [Sphingobium sp.]